jgi:N-acetylmuramoyl-L-alanine amidase
VRRLLESERITPLMLRNLYTRALRQRGMWLAAAALTLVIGLPLLHSAEDKKLTVYASGKTYELAVADVDKQEYAGLAELLGPLGKFEQHASLGTFRLRLNDKEGEFSVGKKMARVGTVQLLLPAKAVVDHGRLLVPVRALPGLLEKYGQKAELYAAGRRLFVGDAGERVGLEVKRPGDNLVVSFPAAVSPTISTEGNKVHLLFTKDPVLFWADSIAYTDKLFTQAKFIEQNGIAEVVISGNAPLVASLGDGGKSISITAAPQFAATSASQVVPQTSAPATSPASGPPAAAVQSNSSTAAPQAKAAPASTLVPFFVMIDASHGGDDPGARFSDKLLEKDITLAIARKLRTELSNRGITAALLRDNDSTLTYDQRAVATNARRAGMYISIHAGVPGSGVRVYTAMLPAESFEKNARPHGPFVTWENAQAGFLSRSQTLATALVMEMGSAKIAAGSAVAPLLPLNSIAAPAVSIEVAPPRVDSNIDSLSAAKYQQAIAAAAATAIANVRGKMEERR